MTTTIFFPKKWNALYFSLLAHYFLGIAKPAWLNNFKDFQLNNSFWMKMMVFFHAEKSLEICQSNQKNLS